MSELLDSPESESKKSLHQLIERVDQIIDEEILANRASIYPNDAIKLAQALGLRPPKDTAKTPSIEVEVPLRDGSMLLLGRSYDLDQHASVTIRREESFVAAGRVKHIDRVLFINRWMMDAETTLDQLGASWTSIEPDDLEESDFEIESDLERLDEEAEQRELDIDTIREFAGYLSLVR